MFFFSLREKIVFTHQLIPLILIIVIYKKIARQSNRSSLLLCVCVFPASGDKGGTSLRQKPIRHGQADCHLQFITK